MKATKIIAFATTSVIKKKKGGMKIFQYEVGRKSNTISNFINPISAQCSVHFIYKSVLWIAM